MNALKLVENARKNALADSLIYPAADEGRGNCPAVLFFLHSLPVQPTQHGVVVAGPDTIVNMATGGEEVVGAQDMVDTDEETLLLVRDTRPTAALREAVGQPVGDSAPHV